ncbi:MAG: hypothetical protein K2J85_06310, partial [Anaeroplasmataceae bacterium]|nr:hypothetical protein [Anaeroplasmataceae bacterium]
SLCLEELKEEGNAVLSPASIFSALALAIECCDGNTRNELLNAIGMEYNVLKENYARFYENLNALEQETNQTKRKLTNSIWINNDFSPKENCLLNLADKYYCYSHGVDFKKTEYVNKYITDFISRQTNGFLKPNLNLSPETIFMILNTLYLRDSWNSRGDDLPFTKEEYKFKNADGTTLSKQFLRGYYKSGKAIATSTYRQFYTTTNEYRLSFIVPLEGYRIEDVFTPTVISDISKSDYTFFNDVENEEDREFYYTRCLFPEFSVSSSFSLENIFKKLGILDLFDFMNADFSNLAASRDLCCTNATHLAKLVVNKKGIEGAAVTYLEAATSAGPVKEIFADFIVDRSFGFVISNFTGVNLFSGI